LVFPSNSLGTELSPRLEYDEVPRATWNAAGAEYGSSYAYDANGNLKAVVRRGYDTTGVSSLMDSLSYVYPSATNNRLGNVDDAVTGDPYPGDLSDQPSNWYQYDQVGNLVNEGGTVIAWDASGKVKRITSGGAGGGTISYSYDAAGNRVKKSVALPAATVNTYYVYDATSTVVAIYEEACPPPPAVVVRPSLPPIIDADGDTWPDSVDCEPTVPNSGWKDTDGDGIPDACDNCPCTSNPNQDNVDNDGNGNACDPQPLVPNGPPGSPGDEDGDGTANGSDPCQCDSTNTCNDCPIQLVELPIYGIGRVGVARPGGLALTDPSNQGPVYERKVGEKFYELTDHLGNVRMVISDIKRSVITGGVPGKFFADVHSYTNAYPYGMAQPLRTWDSSLIASTRASYRFGYNGMEGDPEVLGEGNHYTTPFREYDPRVARWWSNDRIVHSWESPYAAMAGNPVLFSDQSGLEPDEPEEPLPIPGGPAQAQSTSQQSFSSGAASGSDEGMSAGEWIGYALLTPVYQLYDTYQSSLQAIDDAGRFLDRYNRGVFINNTDPSQLIAQDWDRLGDWWEEYRTRPARNWDCLVADHSRPLEDQLAAAWRSMKRPEYTGNILGAVAGMYLGGRMMPARTGMAVSLGRSSPNVFLADEWEIIIETRQIIASPEFGQLRNAARSGNVGQITVGGRLVQFEPGIKDFGLSFVGESDIYLGIAAFKSEPDLIKTMLHEIYRTRKGQGGVRGVSGTLAKEETIDTWNWVDRVYKLEFEGADR
jgi:RHS repeat-associated protein